MGSQRVGHGWATFTSLYFISLQITNTDGPSCVVLNTNLTRNLSITHSVALYFSGQKVLVVQLCLSLCDPMNCSLTGSSFHGVLQTGILEWVGDRTRVSCIACTFLPSESGQNIRPKGTSPSLSNDFTISDCKARESASISCWKCLPCLTSSPRTPKDFPGSSDGKASAYNAGDPGSIPGLVRSLGEGKDNPLQYYCLEYPMDGGAW